MDRSSEGLAGSVAGAGIPLAASRRLFDDPPGAEHLSDLIVQLARTTAERDAGVQLRGLVRAFESAVRADLVVLYGVEGEWLTPRVVHGIEDATSLHAVRLEEEFEHATAGAVNVHDGRPGSALGEALRRRAPSTLMRCSLYREGRALGILYVGRREGPSFSVEESRLVEALGAWAEVMLQQSLERAESAAAVRARDDILAVVAHDLRNPINIISITANALLQRLADPSGRRSVERIIRSVQRADRFMRDLLDVTAMETGTFSIDRHRVEPANLIFAALDSQHTAAADASAIITTDLAPDLPAVEADEERILQVLENLIDNAVKFTSAGGSITVGAAARDEDVLFCVKDTGSGIAGDELPHIFDRFWHARKGARRGTGLGLAICKGIVEAHGGRVWAESTPGSGTTMFFTVPSLSGSLDRVSREAKANILLVDDRADNLLALRTILDSPEYEITTAMSGEEALSLALRGEFAVALIDIAMPGMNGLDVAVHMKELERSRDIPIIFITAFGNDPEEIHKAYSAGGADYLVKPLDPEIVRRKVSVFVGLGRRRRQGSRSS